MYSSLICKTRCKDLNFRFFLKLCSDTIPNSEADSWVPACILQSGPKGIRLYLAAWADNLLRHQKRPQRSYVALNLDSQKAQINLLFARCGHQSRSLNRACFVDGHALMTFKLEILYISYRSPGSGI